MLGNLHWPVMIYSPTILGPPEVVATRSDKNSGFGITQQPELSPFFPGLPGTSPASASAVAADPGQALGAASVQMHVATREGNRYNQQVVGADGSAICSR